MIIYHKGEKGSNQSESESDPPKPPQTLCFVQQSLIYHQAKCKPTPSCKKGSSYSLKFRHKYSNYDTNDGCTDQYNKSNVFLCVISEEKSVEYHHYEDACREWSDCKNSDLEKFPAQNAKEKSKNDVYYAPEVVIFVQEDPESICAESWTDVLWGEYDSIHAGFFMVKNIRAGNVWGFDVFIAVHDNS